MQEGRDRDRAPLGPALETNGLRSLFTPWKRGGNTAAAAAAAAASTGAAAATKPPAAPPRHSPSPSPPSPAPVAFRSFFRPRRREADAATEAAAPPSLSLALAQQHLLAGGKGRALAFDLAGGGAALYAGEGAASLRKISLVAPNAPLALRLPAHSRGARGVAPPAHPGAKLTAVATAGAGLVVVSGETGNTVATVPFAAWGGGGGGGGGAWGRGGGGGGPAPGMSAATWSVAWSPLRPTHELLVGLDGGRVAVVDLRAASSSSASTSLPPSSLLSASSSSSSGGGGGGGGGGGNRAVVSVVRAVGGGGAHGGPPIHTIAPLPAGCEASLVGGVAIAASAAGVCALWRRPGFHRHTPFEAAAGQECLLLPERGAALERGASVESCSVDGGGRLAAVSVRRRGAGPGGGGGEGMGAEVLVYRLVGRCEEEEPSGEEEEEEEEEQREDGEEDEDGGGGGGNGGGKGGGPLRLVGHASASHMTAGALVDAAARGDGSGGEGVIYASGDEARLAPVAWRLPSGGPLRRGGAAVSPLLPSLAAPLPSALPSAVLAVAGARVPGLGGKTLLAAASAGCVRVYDVASAS